VLAALSRILPTKRVVEPGDKALNPRPERVSPNPTFAEADLAARRVPKARLVPCICRRSRRSPRRRGPSPGCGFQKPPLVGGQGDP